MSQALELSLTCPQCSTEFSHPAHTVVDMADEADSEALWQLQNGSLNKVSCPNCQAGGIIPVPVVLNVPEQQMLLVFTPGASQMDEDQLSEAIGPVLQPFLSSVPEEKQAEYMFRPIITDDPAALQQAALGQLSGADIIGDADDAEFDEDGDDDDDATEEELSPEEQQDLSARMGLLQQLFTAQDSLERISLMRASGDLVDDLYLEVIALVTEQAEQAQPELIPTLQKMMNEAEVFIASSNN
ncbi:MAG: hypothetical protein JWP00_1109 [Chloroflexi bacterium]|jgi:hypothetical protein|nr:hypothetical protein [Chloroflexota bacterium]